jgi:penicillin amidase
MRLLKFTGLVALVLLIALIAVLLWYRQASQPIVEGTLALPGLLDIVEVRRDGQGIPTIVARDERDAMFALGFVHAQDRLWQMEFNRRLAAGRLAEILGPSALPTDKFLRTLGVHRVAQRTYETLDEEHRALIDAYVEGVNAQLRERAVPLPPEFILLRAPAPEPWSAADSLAWSLMMAWDLASYSMRMELRRLRLAQRFTRAEIDDIYPPLPGDPVPKTTDYVEMYRLLGVFTNLPQQTSALPQPPVGAFGVGEGLGSNNWVLSGTRTVNGRPLMANDPHLGLTAPPVWYFAAIRAPGLDVIGATLPGLPGVVLGRNDRLAWGMTNTGVDQQDLYLERLIDDGANEYETPTGAQAFMQQSEVIRVKGADDVDLVVRESRHGPVLSGLESIDRAFKHRRLVIALQWAALQPGDHTLTALRALNRARSVADADKALANFNVVTQSVVLADVDGNIGFVAAGRIPLRRVDNDLQGIAPAPGWDERYDWQGFVAHQQAPRIVNPPGGFVATANNRIVALDYPYHLTFDWFPSYRVHRITELIGAREKHDVPSAQAMQRDAVSLAARQMMQSLAAAQPLTTAGREALARLKAWDGTMAADRPEPLLYHAWRRQLALRIFGDDFGDLATEFVAGEDMTRPLLHVLEGQARSRDWCDDRRTEQRFETCTVLMSEALDTAVAQLAEDSGRDVAGLRWGDQHIAIAEHRPFSSVTALARWFELRTPYPGDTHTINVGALSNRPDAPFSTRHTASLRAVYDLGAPTRSVWIQSSGQVGNPFSPLYSSMRPLWRDVEYLPMVPAAPSEPALVLTPR